ncbi:MAG TPA: hypothetical protein DEG69_20660 [Flavobacteriaceae bacterium]|nr:hypothetical protein [Flavobacteriaceae bacterium]
MDSVLLQNYTLDTVTGEVVIPDLNPAQQIAVPDGATHVSFSSGFLNLDFSDPDGYDLQVSPDSNVPITGTANTVTLTPAAAAAGTGDRYYFLKIAFFQEVNGMQYALNNGTHNALQLIEIL